MAKLNRKSYKRLSRLNKILNGKPISLIRKEEKGKVFVKTTDTKGNNNERKAA